MAGLTRTIPEEVFAVKTKTTLRALTEIRLRRSEEVSLGCEPDGERDHLWIPDNRASRERLVRAVVLGNRIHGPASHWIESRQA
jgi:hypothetical protein